jgi:ubiquitin carboxyl-terminal hydrolase 4/11/15
MNSGLQCLSHIELLTKYFITKEYLKDINVDNPLGTHGELSTEYAKMIKNLWLGT